MDIRFLANNEAGFEGTIWKQISPPDQGMRVFVRKSEESNYNRLRNEAKKDYHARYLFNELMSLNNRHGLTRVSSAAFAKINAICSSKAALLITACSAVVCSLKITELRSLEVKISRVCIMLISVVDSQN